MKLDGQWKLYLFEQYGTINAPEELNNYEAIDATVPGNVELDLIHAGILPKDIFMGMNIRQAEKYETYEYW
jgi:beta-mannosidase